MRCVMDIDKVVINYFNRTNSLSLTANMAGISPQKARKILITAGVYETNLSLQIDSARKKGLSDSEIKKLLGISDKVFCSNVPYIKGMYNTSTPSKNALSIRRCRQKKN